jgi:hypothetical protein
MAEPLRWVDPGAEGPVRKLVAPVPSPGGGTVGVWRMSEMKLSGSWFAASAALAFIVLSSTPAGATGPEVYTDHFVLSDTIDCAAFDPSWQFNDNFVDTFDLRGQVFRDRAGNITRELIHVEHHSDDVNSVTGFTLHEHNHYLITVDAAANTVSFSGAINTMQRPGVGSVIRNIGHKVFLLDSDTALKLAGPDIAGDIDFCRAVAPAGSRP